MAKTPGGLQFMAASQNQGEVVFNQMLMWLELLSFRNIIKSQGDNTPPGSPATGDAYILGSSPTGAWAGHANDLALYYGGWLFLDVVNGMRFWIDDEDIWFHRVDGIWAVPDPVWKTTEYFMGKYGISGNKIYQKSVSLGAMPNNASADVAHGISNLVLTQPIIIQGAAWLTAGGGEVIPLNTSGRIATTANRILDCIVKDGTNLRKDSNFDATGYTGYVRLEYERTV